MNLALLLIATILCTSLSQILQKRLSMCMLAKKAANINGAVVVTSPDSQVINTANLSGFISKHLGSLGFAVLLAHSLFWLALGLAVWFVVLSQMEVSRAYPLLSLNVVVVMLLSAALFDDKITRQQVIGAVSILSGVFLLTAGGAL